MGVVQSIIALVGLRKCKGSSEEALKGEVCVGCGEGAVGGGWVRLWGEASGVCGAGRGEQGR